MSLDVVTHIHLDEHGVAWIDDTRIKVIEVAIDKVAHNSTPEEMHEQYPHLSLAQIHAALAYYHDHQEEIDAEIQRQDEECEKLRQANLDSPFRQRMRKLGKLP